MDGGFDGAMLDRGKRFGIAPYPYLGRDSFLATECLTCLCLPNNCLSRRSIAEGPGYTLSLSRESHLCRSILPSRRCQCCARQIRSRFGTAAHAEPMRFVKLHSVWYRFHLRRPHAECRKAGAEALAAKLGPEAGLPGLCVLTLHWSRDLLTSPIPLAARRERR
jgi:hypothetical protein